MCLFLIKKPLTENEFALKYAIHRKKVSREKAKVLLKLKKLLEIEK